MKKVSDVFQHEGSDAWCRTSITNRVHFQIEDSDVGKSRPHYLGFGHKTHIFTPTDVGKVIVICTDGTWTCWFFA